MAKFCIKCGTPLQEGVRFCPKCGATIGQAAAQQPTQPQQPMYQQQPYYGQTQPYVPMPKKSNKKLIIAIIAIVAIIIVVGLLLVFFVFGGDEGKFIGTWEHVSTTTYVNGVQSSTIPSDGSKTTFNSDGTTRTTYPPPEYEWEEQQEPTTGKWEIKNGKICDPDREDSDSAYDLPACGEYKFSNGDKTLTITYSFTPYEGYTYKYVVVLKKV